MTAEPDHQKIVSAPIGVITVSLLKEAANSARRMAEAINGVPITGSMALIALADAYDKKANELLEDMA